MKRRKRSSIGCLFWIALILLLVVIFLLSRSRIENVLKTTGFKDIISTKTEAPAPEVIRKEIKPSEKKTKQTETVPSGKKDETQKLPDINVSVKIPGNKTVVKNVNTVKKERKSTLYFVKVNDDGSTKLAKVIRSVYFIDSPLTDTIKSLLSGPKSSELNKGLLTLIPEKTKLLGIYIKNNTAFINFNDSVTFNSFGEEGLLVSLKQIIYTATEFPTVSKVQILINGKVEKYLSTEGVYVKDPLSRTSFK